VGNFCLVDYFISLRGRKILVQILDLVSSRNRDSFSQRRNVGMLQN